MSRWRGARSVTSRPPIEIVPGGDVLEPGDHAQQRRLAAAGRADEDDELAVADPQAHVVDGGDAAAKTFVRCSSSISAIASGQHRTARRAKSNTRLRQCGEWY